MSGVLLVGLGAIGMGYDLHDPDPERICTHARAFAARPEFGPLIGVDPQEELRTVFASTYGAPAYASLQEALRRHKPSVAVIATPTPTHWDTLREILASVSPKLILCEKPLAYELEVADAMVRACEAQGVALFVNYMRRADPAVALVRAMIGDARMIGPMKGVIWYSKGLIHNGSHFVDLLNFWLGGVQGVTLVRVGRRWQDRDPEPDFVLEYAHGSMSFLAANEECFSHYTVELVARNGRLRYERGGEQVLWQPVVDDPLFAGYRVLAPEPQQLPARMLRSQLHVVGQLARALEGQPSTLCSGREALQTLRDIHRVTALV